MSIKNRNYYTELYHKIERYIGIPIIIAAKM